MYRQCRWKRFLLWIKLQMWFHSSDCCCTVYLRILWVRQKHLSGHVAVFCFWSCFVLLHFVPLSPCQSDPILLQLSEHRCCVISQVQVKSAGMRWYEILTVLAHLKKKISRFHDLQCYTIFVNITDYNDSRVFGYTGTIFLCFIQESVNIHFAAIHSFTSVVQSHLFCIYSSSINYTSM